MKVTIKTEDLLQPLKAHLVLTKDKCTFKILNCCRLFADKEDFGFGKVLNIKSVSLNNDPVLCKTKSICDVEEEGAALVNCEELYKFVYSQRKSKTITICTSDKGGAWDYLDVIAGNSKVTLKQFDLSEFPELEVSHEISEVDNGVTIKACDFIQAIDRAKLCLSKDMTDKKFCNYIIDIKDNNVFLVACDGHQMSYNKINVVKTNSPIEFKKDSFGRKKLIGIDPKSLECVCKVFDNPNFVLDVFIKDEFLCLSNSGTSILVKDSGGSFNFESVIPKDLSKWSKFYVKNCDLKRSIKTVSAATDKKRTVGLSFKEDCLKIFTTENFAKYCCSEDVDYECMTNNGVGIIGFNYKFLLNAIEKMDRYIFIYALDEDSPILIKNNNDDGCIQVVMPMQL